MIIVVGECTKRLFEGTEAYVPTPEGKFTPFNAIPIFTDCRIDGNYVYFGFPEIKGEHICKDREVKCSAYYKEEHVPVN